MGQSHFNCIICKVICNDIAPHGICANCEGYMCESCEDKMQKKYGVIGEDHPRVSWYGENALERCDACDNKDEVGYIIRTPEILLLARMAHGLMQSEFGIDEDELEFVKRMIDSLDEKEKEDRNVSYVIHYYKWHMKNKKYEDKGEVDPFGK